MISLTSHDFFSCFSSIFLGLSACFFLAFFSFFFDKSIYIKENSNRYYFIIKAYCFYITLFILLFALLLECNNPIDSFVSFWGFFSYNFFTHSVTLIILLLSTFVLIGSFAYITKVDFFSFEFFFLYLLAVFALACLPLSADFLGVYLLLELQSLIFYSLASFKRTSSFSTEAGVKYFIIGAFASGILLFGMSLVYGATGSLQFETLKMILFDTSYVTFDLNIFLCYFGFFLIFCSFCFKISAAPFHFWSPEVYEGSVSPVSFFFAVVPKISLFGTLLNICTGVFFEFSFFWENLFYSIALLSFAFGSFSALSQKKTKKFLALSSVTHVGFIIAAASAHSFNGMVSLFFYLFVYSFLSLCFWSVVTFTRKEAAGNLGKYIVDLRYFCKQNILIGVSLAILLFSIAGIPPLSGFGAKFFSFLAVLETNSILLSFCIVLFAVVSCFYYLRVIKWLFFDNAQLKRGIVSNQYPAVLLKISYFESLVFTSGLFFSSFIFIYPDFFILVAHRIALALFL